VSGVSTHLNVLLASRLAEGYALVHHQVGSEGRRESVFGRMARLALGPLTLGAAILRRDAALVHLNSSLNAAYWRDLAHLAAAKLCGARVVFQVHGGALPQNFLGNGPMQPFLHGFLRMTLRLPDAVVVLAQSELAAYRAFLPGQAVTLIPNGIDCAPYAGLGKAQRDEGPLRLLYVGRLAREKGLFETLEALRLVRAQDIEATLLIAGAGPDEARLKAHAHDIGVERDVRFVPPAFGEEKLRLLARADAFLLPSYAEGLPYALLEAMAAGAVPVATRVGAIPDVITDGADGLLVQRRDPAAIARAIARLADPARLARMSAAARRRIATAFSAEQVAERFGALYKWISAKCAESPAG